MKTKKLYLKPNMKVFEVKIASYLLVGSINGSRRNYGESVSNYNETDGGWEE